MRGGWIGRREEDSEGTSEPTDKSEREGIGKGYVAFTDKDWEENEQR